MHFRRIFALFCCFAMMHLQVSAAAHAASDSQFSVPEELDVNPLNKGTEYVSGNKPGAVLMPVNIWGAVGRPGLHHVPAETDLNRMISFAGGPGKEAELEEVTIKRRDSVIHVNLKRELASDQPLSTLRLQPNDVVFVPPKDEGISNNTLKAITLGSAILAILVSGLVVYNQTHK